MARKRITELSKSVGKPKVGGPLTGLVDQRGNTKSEDEFLGKFRLVSEGRRGGGQWRSEWTGFLTARALNAGLLRLHALP